MPHKHKRKDTDTSAFDLPPSQVARALPVNRGSRALDKGGKPKTQGKPKQNPPSAVAGKKRKGQSSDDTPRAFKRLMAFAQGNTIKRGPDDGTTSSKNKKKSKTTTTTTEDTGKQNGKDNPASTAAEMPTIRPDETMAQFRARVDASMPLSGLVTKVVKNGKDPIGLKVKRTRKEKNMHKLYDQWRVEDQKIKTKRQEAEEDEAERRIDEDLASGAWRDWNKDYSKDVVRGEGEESAAGASKNNKSKKKKKKKKSGKGKAEDNDPWAEFQKKHAEPRPGLHDVVKAPPTLQGPGNKIKLLD